MVEKRAELLDGQHGSVVNAGGGGLSDRSLDDDSIQRRHAELVARDNVLGLEARVVTLENRIDIMRLRNKQLRQRAEDAETRVSELQASRTWKVGRMFTRPFGRLKG